MARRFRLLEIIEEDDLAIESKGQGASQEKDHLANEVRSKIYLFVASGLSSARSFV